MGFQEVGADDQDVENSAVIYAVDDPSVVEHRDVRPVLSREAESYVIVGAVALPLNLLPDALLCAGDVVGVKKPRETAAAEVHKVFSAVAPRKAYHLVVGKEHGVVGSVRFINQEGDRKILRDLVQGEAEPHALFGIKTAVIGKAGMLSS